ncbi:MAG: DUF1929 domain-containing protein [Hoeflea sp.]|uniref:galactose oxidase-like domain-containing protein n=1 Tax=Hoeflea sp. TaxID=1940281 RepID=UPI0032ED5A72
MRPTDEHVEGERRSIVISDTDTQGDGEWSNVVALTIIPLHAVVLPDGKVFSFGSTEAGGQGGDFVYSLFDPETGVEKVLENTTGTNIFCSNMALDPETGNVVIFGGDGNRNGGGGISGIDSVTIFDYRTQTMSEAEPMEYARWYPSNITLSNGDILVLGGRDKDYLGSTIPEVYDGETGTFRQLTGADMPDLYGGSGGNLDESWWYPHVWENSKGEVIVVEAFGSDIYRLDTDGVGSVAKIGQTGFESYKLNSSLLYGTDKIAIIGDDGGIYTADISDLSTAPVFTKVATLENARTNATMISLPDGRVLVVGGSTPYGDNTDQGNGLTNAIYTPTIWDPSDNSLEQGEAQALARLYHSSGLLLPDGSIWSGGGGAPGPLVNTNVEFFRPDYMYGDDGNLAQRPEITEAPKNISAGDTFEITIDDSSDIEMVTAIRSGGMTHARNSDTRFVELQFTKIDGTTIAVETPDALILGPGAWMFYAVDSAGVPSEAAIVGVDMAEIFETPPLEQTTLQYYGIDREQINGAFELTVEARFDDLGAGEWQRIFDFGNGPAKDNIWLGQVAGTDDMRFEVWVNGTAYSIAAANSIEEGVRAGWKVSVDESGYMRMWKNGVSVAEGQGAVPADVERTQDYIGDSNWITDQRLVGEVRNLEIDNGNPDPDIPPKVAVEFTGDAVEGDEGETGTLDFVFSLSHVTTKEVTMDYNVLGSATGPESVTIQAGQTQATVTLTFTGDDIQELDELATVEILSATNARLGSKTDISATATIFDDDVQSTPAGMSFFAEAIVRFDDLDGGNWQRVFDYGDGPDSNNIWLGQAVGSNEMRFEILDGQTKYSIDAVDGIVEGETARWTAQITSDGTMQLFKDGVLVAEGEGIVPPDVERPSKLVGSSNWGGDTPLIGEVIAITVDEDGSDDPVAIAPVISIAAPADALEGASGETGTLSYLVSLDKAAAEAVTAKVTIAGNATGPQTVTIPAGETSVALDVSFDGNDDDNPDQAITVSLSDIVNADPGATLSATATILDDDEADVPVNVIETGNKGGYFVGTDGNDDFRGGKGKDVFNGGLGDDVYDGAGGYYNQVDFAGLASDYTFERNDDGSVTVSNPVQGKDTLRNIDGLWFSGEAKWYALEDLVFDPGDPGTVNVIEAGNNGGYFTGTDGKDDFRGGAGKDVFNGGLGDDVYDGAGGYYNQVDFAGSASDYTFERNDDGSVTVSNPVQGKDTLRNIDGLWFSGEAKWYALEDLVTDPGDPGTVNVIEAGNNGGYFTGTDGKDDFRGGAGNDTFVGGKGDDVYDGGPGGYDQVDLIGKFSDYTFEKDADGAITASHAEYGIDVLKNIDGIWVGEDNMWVSTDDIVPTG